MERLRDRLYSITKKIALSNNGVFSVSVERQKDFMNRLPEPGDYIERSYCQFKCQRWLKRKWINILTDLCSTPLIIYYLLKKAKPIITRDRSNVFLSFGIPATIIPVIAQEEYGSIRTLSTIGDFMDKEDKKLISALIKRHPFSPEFILKCLIKVREYSWVINTYNPKALFVSEEYSYTSSFLTYYCNRKGIDHVCLMHGEKLFYIRDSFFSFNRFFVWDNFYAELFLSLRAAPNQFVVAVPPSLIIHGERRIKYDYTYYLANESVCSIEKIVRNLKNLSDKGYSVIVRPHPRYTNATNLQIVEAAGIEVENLQQVSIEESLLSTRNAVSLYSTVLNQAVCNGIGAVIDDITDVEKYNKLIELKYRLVEDKRVRKLSFIV